jgi:hypothetical protein
MANHLDAAVRFVEADLFRLQGVQRTVAIDALTSGEALPFAILGDTVISTGKLDADAIVLEIERFIAAR